jgi:hypothetical protein
VFLLITRGDDVSVLTTREEALAAFAPIDTPSEAVLAASLAEFTVACDTPGRGGVAATEDGFEVIGVQYTSTCPIELRIFRLAVDAAGEVAPIASRVDPEGSSSGFCFGRRPATLRSAEPGGATPLGAYWSRVAHLEAASIPAFAALRRELAYHGAPHRLHRAALRCMLDEVRHTVLTRRLAARHGVRAGGPRVSSMPIRPLEEIAAENAVEGCVRETFGVVMGMWQGRFALDPRVRRIMQSIPRDEARHAALAWAVDAWARRELPAAAVRRVDEARREALAELDRGAHEPHPIVVRDAGVPTARQERWLARRFRDALSG